MGDYFSDRENGPRPRIHHDIDPDVWAGLVALVDNLLNSAAFGYRFPERCPDGQIVCGCNEAALGAAIRAEMPGLDWPLQATKIDEQIRWANPKPFAPPTLLILDVIEFVWRSIGKPQEGQFHSYFNHYHLSFDAPSGQGQFCEEVNRIFARNALAYELTVSGRVVRIPPTILGEVLRRPRIRTGDNILDSLLEESRAKFLDPDSLIRREALERLWDSWERLKSLAHEDKRTSVSTILDRASTELSFRALLEKEARELNEIGNGRLIRHFEIGQTPVIDVDHVDYLYHRLFSMIELLLKKNAPTSAPSS